MAVVAETEAAAAPAVILALWGGKAANRTAIKVEAATSRPHADRFPDGVPAKVTVEQKS